MREDRLDGEDGESRTVMTDDRGTTVLDTAGLVVSEHGSDLHDATLDRLRQEGWRLPEAVSPRLVDIGTQVPDTPADADPTATVAPTTG